jgi:DNA repair photolyase
MKSLVTSYTPKKILNVHKHCDGGWFWHKYTAHPYLGCVYGCRYCYEWDKKYNPYSNPAEFDIRLQVKKNGPDLLAQELASQPTDIIMLGDWQPIETKYHLSRAMLKIVKELGFPVFINEKSPLIVRDLNLLSAINQKSYANVGFSIITAQDDETKEIFEPKAPSIQSRFEAMKDIADAGIMTGTVFMPILPYIYDNEKNIEAVVKRTKEAGGKYVLDGGLTLVGNCQKKYYEALKVYDPKLIAKYDKLYQDSRAMSDYYQNVHNLVKRYCQKYRIANTIPRPIAFYPKKTQVNKLVAEKIYIQAREIQFQNDSDYRVLAYQKVARLLDNLEEDILTIYQKEGRDGLMKIKGIGDKIANFIEAIFNRINNVAN